MSFIITLYQPSILPAIQPLPMLKNFYFSLADLYSAYSFIGKEEKRKEVERKRGREEKRKKGKKEKRKRRKKGKK